MKTFTWRQAFLLLLCAAVLGWAVWQISLTGDHLQYLTLAEKPQATGEEDTAPNAWILELQKTLDTATEDWSGLMRVWTMDALVEKAAYSAPLGESAQGTLTLLGEGGLQIRSLLLRSGRLLHPEELKRGAPVALLDEGLAIAVFRTSDPVDRTVQINGLDYRVVGIVRHTRRVGDAALYGAYIPLMSAVEQPLTLDAVMVEAAPLSGVGAGAAFSSDLTVWRAGGTLIDLGKESMGAWLWLRVLLFLAGLTLVLWWIRQLNRWVGFFHRRWRARLQTAYAIRLTPWAAGRIALFVLGYAAAALAASVLMTMMLRPVYTFPEWVPAVLVEWSDISDAFWKVWTGAAALTELRTPELNRLRFLTLVVDGFSALAGVVLFRLWALVKTPAQRVEKALPALLRQGAAVSVIRTDRPMAFEDLGYVRMAGAWGEGDRAQVPMLRLVNVRRALEALPPSPRPGSFVLEVTDGQIAGNNLRLQIDCDGRQNSFSEAARDWDMKCDAATLARILYGDTPLDAFLESRTGVELHMRSPAMDGLFSAHLREDGRAE